MPRQAAHTSAEERQRLRQHYYATSEQEAGIAHLWHMQRLAAVRLGPSHTIQDAPGVDFQQPGDPVMDHYRQLYADRYAQQVQHDEANIYAHNTQVLRHLLLASDDTARRRRHMNLVPTSAQVRRFDNIQEQTSHRARDRHTRQRQVSEENMKFLGHLVAVPPSVRTAKELGEWYNTVHKRRVQQLSRFKPAEPFAGARVLASASSSSSSRKWYARSGGAAPFEAAPRLTTAEVAACPPLLRGHPHPPLSIAEAARTAPASLLPAVRTTSYGGVPLVLEGSTDDLEDADSGAGGAAAETMGYGAAVPRAAQRARAGARPEWQPISATDIPLLHYAADLQLRRDGGGGTSTRARGGGRSVSAAAPHGQRGEGGSVTWTSIPHRESNAGSPEQHGAAAYATTRLVSPAEEGAVTQLWRNALQQRRCRTAAPATVDGLQNAATLETLLPFAHTLHSQPTGWGGTRWEETGGCSVQRSPSTEPPATSAPPPAQAAVSRPSSGSYRRQPLSPLDRDASARAPGERSAARRGGAPADQETANEVRRRCDMSRGAYAPV
ncbi:hypothetical protein NESM_000769600 [Novymonas esmeraldas]|uniref:Uncharacterized protein n=1 Tax=Novymonas esmeraldas TaxID=1808958 RepID=A0AAW0EYM6_9TRYP